MAYAARRFGSVDLEFTSLSQPQDYMLTKLNGVNYLLLSHEVFNLQVPTRIEKVQRKHMIRLKFSKSRVNYRGMFSCTRITL